ncbi:hypothetical protein [Anatilimnocola floriformis]|uniref:hypothetical protein n=1 Tax=Anatilimnocola floriformis TaxID=2948575 RepID=UPI0020C3C156|nr:hypothetical protein [Anatilimnocola floriformis]
MIDEPPIGATLSKHPTENSARGLISALLLAAVGLIVPLALWGFARALAFAFRTPSAQPSVGSTPLINWTTLSFVIPYLTWVGGLTGLLWRLPARNPGFLRSLRIAAVAALLAILANRFVFPRGINFEDDPDARIRIFAALCISVAAALCIRNSKIWDY